MISQKIFEHQFYYIFFFLTGTSPDTDSDVKMFEEPDKWE